MDQLPVTRLGAALLLLAACGGPRSSGTPGPDDAATLAHVTPVAERIAAVSERTPMLAWDRLTALVERYPRRINGSTALDGALTWAVAQMRDDGIDDVRLEPVLVPHWVRGTERARVIRPRERSLAISTLGGSVGTHGTVRAPLVTFASLDDLRASTRPLDGAVVFVNHRMPPFDDVHDDPGYRYGVQARLHAASAAARRGAAAVLVRSVTAVVSPHPHTGALAYDTDAPTIPAAALSTTDADALAELVAHDHVQVELSLGAHMLPDAPSANVVGELRGRERADEIVLLGAHIDSWDVGPGAADDGAGVVAVVEALRLLRQSGLVPRRTVRVVLFTSEEYLLAGARAYHERHAAERHVAAFETDYGMGAPDAIGAGTADGARAMAPLGPAFARFGIRRFLPRAFGADVEPVVAAGAAAFDLEPDGRHYFDVHHSTDDDLDAIRPEDLRRNAGAIALLAWVLAER